MAPHPDLITREQAAALLCCSRSKLAHGWGPPPLPDFKRPVMYSRLAIDKWLEDQRGIACSTVVAVSGGSSSSTTVSQSASARASAIRRQRRRRLATSGTT